MDNKKLFAFLFMSIFLISMASALEFDNVKSYDPNTREVTITNAFGLGDTIGKARLNTPLNVKVPIGYQKVAEFDLWAYQDYNDALKGITFYDRNEEDWEKHSFQRDFDFKKKVYKDVWVNDYEKQCVELTNINGTYQECENVLVGKHQETEIKWDDLLPTDLKKEEMITVGIFTNVQEGDNVEWIPSIYGVEVDEWATWTADFNVDIVAYYKLEETSGNYIDATPNGNDCTPSGDLPTAVSGVIDNGQNLDGTTDYFTCGDIGDGSVYTINFWANPDAIENNYQPISKNVAGSSGWRLFMQSGDHLRYEIQSGGSEYTIDTADSTFSASGGWYMVTLLRRANQTAEIYINGVQVGHDDTTTYTTNDVDLTVGGVGSNNFDGQMDEMSVWDRALSPTEITDLYNSGSGLQYVSSFDSNPNITLISPLVDANYSTHQNIAFNYSVYDDVELSDVKLYVNDVLNQTNATGINNTVYSFNVPMGDGSFKVYGIATDNESQTANSDNITIVIDSTAPTLTDALNLTDQITLTLPINSTWNYTASDNHIDDCYYNTSDNASQTIVTCNASISTQWATEGNKTIQYCANDTFGNEACLTDYVYIYYITNTSAVSIDPISEGATETWNLTVNLTNTPTITANININGTMYDPTTTVAGTNGYFFEFVKQIPDGWGNTTGNNLEWYWNYTIDGVVTDRNASVESFTVYEMAIDDCSSYGIKILDFNFNDEETNTPINETAGSNAEISIDLMNLDDHTILLSHNETWANNNTPTVCVPDYVLNNSQWQINFTVGFQATDKVWEFYYLDDGVLNTSLVYNSLTTDQINLMDLTTADSTSFLFNYFDVDGLAVDGAMTHVFRKYIGSGIFREVERAKADQNGDTIVHLVEEDVIYYFVITKDGTVLYTSSTYTALCQATPCTIQIEASGSGATFPDDWDLVDDGAYTITDDPDTRTASLEFSSTDASTWNFTVYQYNSDGSYTALNTTSATGTSGTETLTVPLSAGNVSFFATVHKDDDFIKSEWINFENNPQDAFGTTLSLLIAGLIILSLGLMAVTTGGVVIVWVILGVVLSGFLGLMTTELSTGLNMVIYLVLAGGIILWKLTRRRD